MIISHSRRFVFVHIHKTGGTSLENALDPHLAWNDLILGGSPFGEKIQQPYRKKFGLNKHSTVSEIERICGGELIDNYYVFALVRHPLARICSMYNFIASTLNKWAQQQNIEFRDVARHITPEAAKRKPALKWGSSNAFLRSQNFSEFIRQPEMSKAPGFRAQADCLTALDGLLKAEALRLEDLPSWLDSLRQRLGLEFEVPRDNESRTRLVDGTAVSPDDRAYIETLFCRDYEVFGYDA